MSDHEQLLVVVAVIYLSDCVFWASRCAVVFRDAFLAGKYRFAHASTLLGSDRGGIVWRNPLPPFGMTLVCPDRPISLTPEHAYAYTSASAVFGGRPDHRGRLVALDEVKSVKVDGKDVRVNGEPFVRGDSHAQARQLAGTLDRIARLPKPERAAAITADIERSLDTAAIEARLTQYDGISSNIRLVCTCLFLLLFLALPWIVLRDLLAGYWQPLLAGLVLCVILIAVLYRRAHRVLYPDDRGDRASGLAMLLLVPPAAVRACDGLARNLVAGYDVLAVARVVCDRETFARLAGRVLRDLTYPARPVCPAGEAGSASDSESLRIATEARHRADVLAHYVRFLEREGEPVDTLLGAPKPDEGALSYCPRCHEQFLLAGGECTACGGIPLVEFPRAGSAEAEATLRLGA